MNRRIRVLEMIDDATIGGGQIHLLLLVDYLDKSQFDVEVACAGEGFLVDELRKKGISALPLEMYNLISWQTMKKTIDLLRRGNYDILHTHGGTSGFWGRLASVYLRAPKVRIHTYHGIHYVHHRGLRSGLFSMAERILLRHTERVIVVCPSDKKKALSLKIAFPEKTTVVNNGIELKNYTVTSDRNAMRRQFKTSPDSFVFGTIGRLNIQKGQAYLIEAFAQLYKEYPDIVLWIVGSGELLEELKGLADKYDIAGAVRFTGDRDDINLILAAMDAFVLPSIWEGLPLALLEAMASGKAVIATGVDGIADMIINMENGILVPARDPFKLAEAMKLIFSDGSLRAKLIKNAHQTLSDSYSAQRMAGATGRIYTEEYEKHK